MKIYISADIEGVCGITHTKQTLVDGFEHERAKKLLTGEVNAAIEGALAGGATEIVVNDSHYSMRNLAIEDLNPAARLLTGFPKTLLMMEGIDSSYAGSVFVGYHAMSRSMGVLAHTISSYTFFSIRINGKEFGETALNAALAGHFNVPVLAVTGDNVLKDEVFALLPGVEYAQVKRAVGSRAAECLSLMEAHNMIRKKVETAVESIENHKPFKVEYPVILEVVLGSPAIADVAQAIPGIRRVSADAVAYKACDFVEVMQVLFSIMAASSVLQIGAYI